MKQYDTTSHVLLDTHIYRIMFDYTCRNIVLSLFVQLRQRLLAVPKIKEIPIFDLALFLSMCKQCQRLLTLHQEGCAGNKKAGEMFKTLVARCHYRFRESFGGYSQMVSHVVLNQTDFCVSIVPRRPRSDDDSSSEDDDEGDDKQTVQKGQKNRKAGTKPKMIRYQFTPGTVFLSPDQSYHKNEVARTALNHHSRFHSFCFVVIQIRISGGRFTFIKGGTEEAKPRDEGFVNDKNFNMWLFTARSIKIAFNIPAGQEGVDVYGGCLMQFEGI